MVPFHVGGKAVGTIWAVAHDDHEFDAEDKRQLLSLARFAATAYQCAGAIGASRHLAAIVESSDDAIISKNLDGIITSWNQSAERLFGYTAEEAIGKHITLILPKDRYDEEPKIIERLRRGERVDHFETVRQRKDGTCLDISLTISPVKDTSGVVIGASKVARDITERKEVEKVRRETEVTSRLLRQQDAERRRIARELHDGIGQLMVAIGMNVAQVMGERQNLSPTVAKCVAENSSLVQQAASEIRTVSYLLHPPLLDEVGLQAALKMYVEGFAERSRIDISLELDSSIGRLPEDYELSLFRIAQECLTNIHRHSGSATALIRMEKLPGHIEFEIKDEGGGIKKDVRSRINSGSGSGVGFRGMQERVKQMGGTLDVQSSGKGTSVRVLLPISA
jgi:PAS domain S-box-containing protein